MKNKKKHFLLNEISRCSKWLITGIATVGLVMSIGSANVNAESKSEANLTRSYQKNKSFSQQFKDKNMNYVPVETGKIQIGSDNNGPITLTYFNGKSNEQDLGHQIGGGEIYGEVKVANGDNPMFMAPNFNITNGDGSSFSWVHKGGSLENSAPFFAGINNDWDTVDNGHNWRIWSIEKSNNASKSENSGSEINSTITMKFTGDFNFNTDKTYTLDFTMTLKPNGQKIDYNLSVRNVTALVNPNISLKDTTLKGFWFGSQYDTMLNKDDNVPVYYIGKNQGLYLKQDNYKVGFNFTSKNAPTGWAAIEHGKFFSSGGINSPSDPGQKGLNAPKDSVAFKDGNSGLYMVWKSQDLASGNTRKARYQMSVTSDATVLPKLTLDKQTDKYYGGDYNVSGKVVYNKYDNPSKSLKYYYRIDDRSPVEFEGPQNQDISEHPFSFTIPPNQMKPGYYYKIYVYVVDSNGVSSKPQILELKPEVKIYSKESNYFVGDKFDKFSSFDGGAKIDGTPLTKDDITDVKITDAKIIDGNRVLEDLSDITSKPGSYLVHYTYQYGEGKNSDYVSAVAKINVHSGDDALYGADFTLRDWTYYVNGKFNAADCFVNGRKNGSEPMKTSDLEYTIQDKNGEKFLDSWVTKYVGNYSIIYKYAYGNNGQTLQKKVNIKVIEPAYILLDYVDEQGIQIDSKYLTGLPDTMSRGDHHGAWGSEIDINLPKKLGDRYEFVRMEGIYGESAAVTPIPIPNNKLVFGDTTKIIRFVYRDSVIGDNSKNAVTVHHYLRDRNGNNTTIKVPGMNDIHKGGKLGDELVFKTTDSEQVPPQGYTLVPGQSDQSWKLNSTHGREINFYYTADAVNSIRVIFENASNLCAVGDYIPEGNFVGDVLNLRSEDIVSKVPRGYHIADDKELMNYKHHNGEILKQEDNPRYEANHQKARIYVVGDRNSSITVNFVDIKTGDVLLKDVPEGHVTGEELDLRYNPNDPDNYINRNLRKIQERTNNIYEYVKDADLVDKKQPNNVKYGDPSVPVTKTVYVSKSAPRARTITVKCVGEDGNTPDTTLQVREGQSYSIDLQSIARKVNSRYRLLPGQPDRSRFTGTYNDLSDGPNIIRVYFTKKR